MYCVGSGIWSGVFAVPNIVTDAHLKLASGLSVKVLLLTLRRNGRIEPSEMADLLGQSVTDIQDAVNYWVALGLLSTEEAEPGKRIPTQPADPAPVAASRDERPPSGQAAREDSPPGVGNPSQEQGSHKVTTLSSSRPRLTTQEINELAAQDKNITYLLQETQTVMGKPLTPIASSTMASLYSYAGMKPDLILMLVHYCVSIGKDSMRYIERLADDWVDKGVDTHEKAEAEIMRLTKKNRIENKIKTAFGIYDRNLVTSEMEFIRVWTEDYRLELPLIKLAFERCVELKGKISFSYINGILGNWHSAGISTPAQALDNIKSGKGKASSRDKSARDNPSPEKKPSYDIGELEKLIDGGGL